MCKIYTLTLHCDYIVYHFSKNAGLSKFGLTSEIPLPSEGCQREHPPCVSKLPCFFKIHFQLCNNIFSPAEEIFALLIPWSYSHRDFGLLHNFLSTNDDYYCWWLNSFLFLVDSCFETIFFVATEKFESPSKLYSKNPRLGTYIFPS